MLIYALSVVDYMTLAIGLLSEEFKEAKIKDFKKYRKHLTRKCDRIKCNEVLFKRLFCSSDPFISSLRKIVSSKKKEVPIEPISDEAATPYEYFKLFVDDNLIDVLLSSLYSYQSSGTSVCDTPNEIESFIGVYFRMGLVKLPSVRSYWETFMNYDGVSSVLSRNRFLSILCYLHFVDNLKVTDKDKKNDWVWKLSPWLEKRRENFLKVSPEENQSVDEIMVAFKARSFLKQYVTNKPNKWGFKFWGRCGVSGYLYDFDLYQGKEIK
ncbi:piggyBac transposable element-derived protein 3-like [Hydra vulgaris]|uniref:piggyBac transposable element-derived protein 3-like n=1 Tax=Hydra vulgaris TaxID=6087 RepID=UPI001F5F65D2|nr:piggyBac transposable element-derived protein 3-like [Hydra vulgaris]